MSYLPNRALLAVSVSLAILTLALLAACSQGPVPLPLISPPTPTPTAAPPTATPLPRGGTLSVRLDADVPNLRPWQPRSRGEEQIVGLLYRGLTRLDSKLAPQPDLASTWSSSADGRTITFTLRSGLTWHDGQSLTSEDVAYTISALKAISPTTALLSDVQRIAAVSTPTSTTVAISLTERYAPIFSALTVPILPKHLLIDKDIAALDFWSIAVGSGPFQLAGRDPGRRISLRASPSFYRGAPLLDGVDFVVVSDPKEALAALRAGRLSLAELPWSAAQTITQTAPGLRAGAYPENGYYFLAMNSRAGRPTSDARVRQALAAAVDVPAIVREATDGQGVPVASSAPPGTWADLTPLTATADLARARRLLDEAGWKVPEGGQLRQQGGITLTLQLFVRADDPRRVRAAELIARAAAAVGVDVRVQRADFATAVRARYAPPYDFDLLLGSWSNGSGDPSFADYAFYDPDDFGLFHSSQVNQGVLDTRPVLNITGFSDPTYDSQSVAARQLYDMADRVKAQAAAQGRVAVLKPYLFLWDDRIPVAASPRLSTLDGPPEFSTPMYLADIERWFFAP